MTKKKMGSMGKLSQFSGIKPIEPESTVVTSETAESLVEKTTSASRSSSLQKLVAINIKITKEQKDWLASTAYMVRDNNSEPVRAGDRVYPQHLIGVAIDLLREADLDWNQVRNIESLRDGLNI